MKDWLKNHDWLERALKTFAQAFLGVLIPELVGVLTNGFPDMTALQIVLSPALAAALAAGISAVWNIALEKLKEGE